MMNGEQLDVAGRIGTAAGTPPVHKCKYMLKGCSVAPKLQCCAAVKQLLLRPPVAPVAPPAQRPAIGALPTSELLGRLQQFLPAMHSANAELATDPMAVRSSERVSTPALVSTCGPGTPAGGCIAGSICDAGQMHHNLPAIIKLSSFHSQIEAWPRAMRKG